MKKIAVFVEGQSEMIFLSKLLYHLIDPSHFSFECMKLYADRQKTAYRSYRNPNADIHFQIINVGNDERVLSVIKEREKDLFRKNFTKIIGLRDMYSKAYIEKAKSKEVIDDKVIRKFIDGAKRVIGRMSIPGRIRFHFSIMEMEAWWLSMYNLFSKIDGTLTCKFISRKLGYNLSEIDPESAFVHPARETDRILKLVGSGYNKKFDEAKKITSVVDASDVGNATENNRCNCFRRFCEELTSD